MFRTTSLTLAMAAIAWLGSLDTALASYRGRQSCCCNCCQCASACATHEHAALAAPGPQSAAKAPSTRRYSYEPSTVAPAANAAPSRSFTNQRGFGTTPRSMQLRSKGDPGRYNF